jgi:hypothetical protein
MSPIKGANWSGRSVAGRSTPQQQHQQTKHQAPEFAPAAPLNLTMDMEDLDVFCLLFDLLR